MCSGTWRLPPCDKGLLTGDGMLVIDELQAETLLNLGTVCKRPDLPWIFEGVLFSVRFELHHEAFYPRYRVRFGLGVSRLLQTQVSAELLRLLGQGVEVHSGEGDDFLAGKIACNLDGEEGCESCQ